MAFVLKKEVCLGVVYNPILNEMYTARVGTGAFLNGKPIHCSKIEKLEDACIGHEVSFIRVERHRVRNIKQVNAFAAAAQGYAIRLEPPFRNHSVQKLIRIVCHFSVPKFRFRSFGSCCVSMSFVARGTLDGYQMNELYVWDIAAASLLVREAGGYCCKPDGSPIDLNDPKIICAATKKLCDEMIKLNKEALGL